MKALERVYGAYRDYTSLADILLVLLNDAKATAHQLHQRHLAIFGAADTVDQGRIASTLSRLEKTGHVTWHSVREAGGSRHCYELTDTGRQRQHLWLHEPPADTTIGEFVVRGLLAAETAASPEAFEGILRAIGPRRLRPPAGSPLTASTARDAYHHAVTQAVVSWLADLRDQAAASRPPSARKAVAQ